MDDWVGRILQPMLAKYVANFNKKEQLNLNLMKGKGLMRNLVIKTDEVNALLEGTPLRFAHIAINHLCIKAAITRLSTQPVTVDIDHIDIDVYEHLGGPNTATSSTTATSNKRPLSVKLGGAPPTTSEQQGSTRRTYGLTDRIADGLLIEINEVRIRLRTLGRRKVAKIGPWNPPDGLWVFRKLRFVSTDESGIEGDLEECWRCNRTRKVDFYVFKRLSAESFTFSLLPRGNRSVSSQPLLVVQDTPLECSFTIRRSLYDVNTWLGVEVDIRLDRCKLRLARGDGTFGHLVAFMTGFVEFLASRNARRKEGTGGAGGAARIKQGEGGGDGGRLHRGYSDSSCRLWRDMSAMFDLDREIGAVSVVDGGKEDEKDISKNGEEAVIGDGGPDDGSDEPDFVPNEDQQEENLSSDLIIDPDILPKPPSEDDAMLSAFPPAEASMSSSGTSSGQAMSVNTSNPPVKPRMRMAGSITITRGEIKLIDDDIGGWVLNFQNLRMETIKTEHAAPCQSILQLYLGFFDFLELGRNEGPIVGIPVYIRSASAPSHAVEKTDFPAMEPRGIRVQLEEAAEDDDEDMSMLHRESDVLAIKLHTLSYPPFPPPRLSSELEAYMDRIHVVVNVTGWTRLFAFVRNNVDHRCLTGHWGPEAEGYEILQVPQPGVRQITFRGGGFKISIPPSSEGGYGSVIDFSCGEFMLSASADMLPSSLMNQLDPRLIAQGTLAQALLRGGSGYAGATSSSSATKAMSPGPVLRGDVSSSHTGLDELAATTAAVSTISVAPRRVKVTLSDVGLSAPSGGSDGETIKLLHPTSCMLLLSVGLTSPLPSAASKGAINGLGVELPFAPSTPPEDCFYVPLDSHATLSISWAFLDKLHVHLDPRLWLMLCDLASVHLQTFKKGRIGQEESTSLGLTEAAPVVANKRFLRGANLAVNLKCSAIRLTFPGPLQASLPSKPPDFDGKDSMFVDLTAQNTQALLDTHADGGIAFGWLLNTVHMKVNGSPLLEVGSSEERMSSQIAGSEKVTSREEQQYSSSPANNGDILAHFTRPRPENSDISHEQKGQASANLVAKLGGGARLHVILDKRFDDMVEHLHAVLCAHSGHLSFLEGWVIPPKRLFPVDSVGRALHAVLHQLLTKAREQSFHTLGKGSSTSLHQPQQQRQLLSFIQPVNILVEAEHLTTIFILDESINGHPTRLVIESRKFRIDGVLGPAAGSGGGRASDNAVSPTAAALSKQDGEGEGMHVEGSVRIAMMEGPRSSEVLPEIGMKLAVSATADNGAGEEGGWKIGFKISLSENEDLYAEVSARLGQVLKRIQERLASLSAVTGGLLVVATPSVEWIRSLAPKQEKDVSKDVVTLERVRLALQSRLVEMGYKARVRATGARRAFEGIAAEISMLKYRYETRLTEMEVLLAEKEQQRQHLLALHHADFAGIMRVGPASSRALKRGIKAKALLKLPRLWCVLRKDLLLCYDQPHSLHIEMALPLQKFSLRDFVPSDPPSSRHYRRVHSLIWQGKTDPRCVVFVCESEGEMALWKTALEPFLQSSAVYPPDAPILQRPATGGGGLGDGGVSLTDSTSGQGFNATSSSTPKAKAFRKSLMGRLNLTGGIGTNGGGGAPTPTDQATMTESLKRKHSFAGHLRLPRFPRSSGHRPAKSMVDTIGRSEKSNSGLEMPLSPSLTSSRKDAERIRQFEISIRGVVPSIVDTIPISSLGPWTAAAGGATGGTVSGSAGGSGVSTSSKGVVPAACYVIFVAIPGVGGRGGVVTKALSSDVLLSIRSRSPRENIAVPDDLARLEQSLSTRSDITGIKVEQEKRSGDYQTSVARNWTEILAFHGYYMQQWTNALEEAEMIGARGPAVFGASECTGMSDVESSSYANQLLLGSQRLLQIPGSAESERRQQVDLMQQYFRLIVSCVPPDRECLHALQRFLGISSVTIACSTLAQPSVPIGPGAPIAISSSATQVPSTPDGVTHAWIRLPSGLQSSTNGGTGVVASHVSSAKALLDGSVTDNTSMGQALKVLKQRIHGLEAAVAGAQLTQTLQAAVFDDYARATSQERKGLEQEIKHLRQTLMEAGRRSSSLEDQLLEATLVRDDTLLAMTEVSTDASRKLMEAELRYSALLRKSHHHHHQQLPSKHRPRPSIVIPDPVIVAKVGGGRRDSYGTPPRLSIATSSTPSHARPSMTNVAASPQAGVTAPLQRRPSFTNLNLYGTTPKNKRGGSGGTSTGGDKDKPVTTQQQRREQLEELLQSHSGTLSAKKSTSSQLALASTPKGSNIRRGSGDSIKDLQQADMDASISGSSNNLQLLGGPVVSQVHHYEVVLKLKTALAIKEEEGRALKESLTMAQEELETHRLMFRRVKKQGVLPDIEEEEDRAILDQDNEKEEDGEDLFAKWRRRLTMEREHSARLKRQLEASKAHWQRLLVELGQAGAQESQRHMKEEDLDSEIEGDVLEIHREYGELMRLIQDGHEVCCNNGLPQQVASSSSIPLFRLRPRNDMVTS